MCLKMTALGALFFVLYCHGCTSTLEDRQFRDSSQHAGIEFIHENGATGDYLLVEITGGGGAFFDYDGDGDLDIYLVNGFDLAGIETPLVNLVERTEDSYVIKQTELSTAERSKAKEDYRVFLPAMHKNKNRPTTNILYRNQGDGTFVDVSQQANVANTGYGMGCAVADYDNDGHADLYVTNFGPNTLYHNQGDGTFVDVTAAAGVIAAQFSTSAVFFDYDNDGYLDLYIANNVDFTTQNNQVCGGFDNTNAVGTRIIPQAHRTYCGPKIYRGVPDVLLRNLGDGTFADVSEQAGIANPAGKGLGVIAWDYDQDGDQDLYVANDGVANFLYRNQGNGTFDEVALKAAVAYNREGRSEAGMGVDFGDYDTDGDFDLFVVNFSYETNTLYRNENTHFKDVSDQSGLAEPSLSSLGFGTQFFDYDNDGDLDIYVANGHVLDKVALFQSGVEFEEPDQLFANDDGRFTEVSSTAGSWFTEKYVGRGAAFGDYDDDGDVDILVVNSGGPAKLLENVGGVAHNWLTIRTVGKQSNRDGIGARVRIGIGDLVQMRQVRSGSSYLSASDPRVHFGLGNQTRVDWVEVKWPSGNIQRHEDVAVNQILVIEEEHGDS